MGDGMTKGVGGEADGDGRDNKGEDDRMPDGEDGESSTGEDSGSGDMSGEGRASGGEGGGGGDMTGEGVGAEWLDPPLSELTTVDRREVGSSSLSSLISCCTLSLKYWAETRGSERNLNPACLPYFQGHCQ